MKPRNYLIYIVTGQPIFSEIRLLKQVVQKVNKRYLKVKIASFYNSNSVEILTNHTSCSCLNDNKPETALLYIAKF